MAKNRSMLKQLSALVLLTLPALFLQAQEAPTVTRYRVTVDHVKPGMETVWRELQQTAVVPALRQAGVTQRRVYHTVLGDTTEFVSYTPFPDYAEMDGPAALERALGTAAAAALQQKLNDCLLGSSSHLELSRDEIFDDPGAAPALMSTSYRPASGRGGDYLTFLHEHMWTPIKRALDTDYIEGFQVFVSNQGGEVGIYTLNIHYANFDGLDGPSPAAKMMSPEESTAFFSAWH